MTALFDWGAEGVARWRDQAAALVVVDVLSFSTCVDIACARGARTYPFVGSDPRAAAARLGAICAGKRREGGLSLSPASLSALPEGETLLLPSPNGSRLSALAAEGGAAVFAGCLRNARAVAACARRAAGEGAVAVIAAGERWPGGALRPCLEDQLGAGAILAALDGPFSAEAEAARRLWESCRSAAPDLIRDSDSGVELQEMGFPQDVEIAVETDVSTCAPRLMDGAFAAAPAPA